MIISVEYLVPVLAYKKYNGYNYYPRGKLTLEESGRLPVIKVYIYLLRIESIIFRKDQRLNPQRIKIVVIDR